LFSLSDFSKQSIKQSKQFKQLQHSSQQTHPDPDSELELELELCGEQHK
jgi:hypothetical protein